MGKLNSYHYHLTLKEVNSSQLAKASKTIKGKPTPIDLEINKNSLQDRMVTKYSVADSVFSNLNEDIETLSNNGYDVSRVKIEKIVESFEVPNSEPLLYSEVHIKVNKKLYESEYKFLRKSKNTSDESFFLNGRLSLDNDSDLLMKEIDSLPKEMILSKQFEHVMFDSNSNHDKTWWE